MALSKRVILSLLARQVLDLAAEILEQTLRVGRSEAQNDFLHGHGLDVRVQLSVGLPSVEVAHAHRNHEQGLTGSELQHVSTRSDGKTLALRLHHAVSYHRSNVPHDPVEQLLTVYGQSLGTRAAGRRARAIRRLRPVEPHQVGRQHVSVVQS